MDITKIGEKSKEVSRMIVLTDALVNRKKRCCEDGPAGIECLGATSLVVLVAI